MATAAIWLLELASLSSWSEPLDAKVVEIIDKRDGQVVQSFDCDDGTSVLEHRISDDLEQLAVAGFQEIYGIAAEE